MKWVIGLLFFVASSAHADVFIIGDSISNEYTPYVQQVFPCVIHNPGNAHSTEHILANLNTWLGNKHYSIIHFNAGLWDIVRRNINGGWDVNGTRDVPPYEYQVNLGKIVTILQAHADVVIFATTTPAPEGAKGRLNSDVIFYNHLAIEVMEQRGVIIDDLNSLMQGQDSLRLFPTSIHFGDVGAALMANQVEQMLMPFIGC